MFQELKFQLSTAILTLLTLVSGVSAIISFQQQSRFHLPDDGVIWVDRGSAVEALHVAKSGPAARVGVRDGDILLSINENKIRQAIDVPKVLVGIGAQYKAKYVVRRSGVEVTIQQLVVGETPRDPAVFYLYFVGVTYLVIGLFVYYFYSRKRSEFYKG